MKYKTNIVEIKITVFSNKLLSNKPELHLDLKSLTFSRRHRDPARREGRSACCKWNKYEAGYYPQSSAG